jgi:hypothetical protein
VANSKSIGIAYSDQDISGADTLAANVTLGYAVGGQGSVTQATSKSTGVTLNKPSGQITMNGAALAAQTNVGFTLTNSTISAKDTLILTIASGATVASYNAWVTSLTAGSATLNLRNITAATSLSEAVVLNFAIIHLL